MCGMDFIEGSKVPTDVLSGRASAVNAVQVAGGCLVVAVVVVLLVWLFR
jgi:hypothetical protein